MDTTKTKSLLESLLFISGKPMSIKKLSEILKIDKKEVSQIAETLTQEYNQPEHGVHIMKAGQSYQMTTNPQNSNIIKDFIKSEQTGELTKPSLETLTIIAYRGPVTKAELEQIRGVNCGLIIRNLLIKGLVEAREDKEKMATVYSVTFDFLRFLGINRVEELPEYDKLNSDENLRKLLDQRIQQQNSENRSQE